MWVKRNSIHLEKGVNRPKTYKHMQIKEHLRKKTPKCPNIPSTLPTSLTKAEMLTKSFHNIVLGVNFTQVAYGHLS